VKKMVSVIWTVDIPPGPEGKQSYNSAFAE